jgi:hypothetical protein
MFNFMLSYNPTATNFSAAQLHSFVVNNKHLASWYTPFAGTYLLKSDLPVPTIAEMFRPTFNGAEFIISFIQPTLSGGGLSPEGWNWLNGAPMPNVLQSLLQARK